MKSFTIMLVLPALALIGASILPVRAQSQGAAARFPEPARVTADYPDDAGRAAAFYVLSEALAQAAPKPISRDDYAKLFKYQAASNAVISQHMITDGTQSQAYRDFNTRFNQLSNSAPFVQVLLDKYHLNGLPTYASPAGRPPTAEEELKYDVPTQLTRALPWILVAGILPMALAAWLVLRGSGIGRKIFPVPVPVPGGLPALPPSLQVVSVPGVRYAVYTLSGRVLNVQTSSHTSTHTHTTGGDTYQSPTGQIHTNPIQSWTSRSTTQETVIWVRTPDQRETSWTLFNSTFQCRAGQIISILVRPLRSGEGEILLAYNHAAGVLEKCPALTKSHEPRGNELGQWAANIAGAYVAARVLNHFLPMYDHSLGEYDPGAIVAWLVATFLLVVISFFILTPLVKSFILKRRNARFNAKYLPGYRQFFERGTPFLQSALRPL